jgi:hypothetical protein
MRGEAEPGKLEPESVRIEFQNDKVASRDKGLAILGSALKVRE